MTGAVLVIAGGALFFSSAGGGGPTYVPVVTTTPAPVPQASTDGCGDGTAAGGRGLDRAGPVAVGADRPGRDLNRRSPGPARLRVLAARGVRRPARLSVLESSRRTGGRGTRRASPASSARGSGRRCSGRSPPRCWPRLPSRCWWPCRGTRRGWRSVRWSSRTQAASRSRPRTSRWSWTRARPAGTGAARLRWASRLRVLGLFSLPEGGQPLNLRRERQSLVRLIERDRRHREGGRRPGAPVRRDPRAAEDVLARAEGWDIIHISGHGAPGELLLETAGGQAGPGDRHRAGGPPRRWRAERLKLVTVTACWSAALTAAEQRRLLGLPAARRRSSTR